MSFRINIPDYILFEDDVILVMNKPAGLMVEPDRNRHPNLLQLVKEYLESKLPLYEEVYVQHIHRIDRPVSGIVLFTKQRAVLKNLSEQFAERRVRKFYKALTENAPAAISGTLEHWHRKEKKKAVLYDTQVEYAEKALLHYSVSETEQHLYLWNIELHTGKYHQIRAQLASVGCPIIGDSLYGSTSSYGSSTIALHACKLVFFHPITDNLITLDSEAPFEQFYNNA